MRQRQGDKLKSIVFDAEAVNSIDTSALMMLEKTIANLRQDNIEFYITNAIGPVRDVLYGSALQSHFVENRMFTTLHNAINYIDNGISDVDDIAMQTSL